MMLRSSYNLEALRAAQEGLQRKRAMKSKGFKNDATAWISPTNLSDSRSGRRRWGTWRE